MAAVTFTEDRETFERQLSQSPWPARFTDHAKRFVGRLDNVDKNALMTDALDRLWETRDEIKETQDILRSWVKALEFAARRRPRWHVWSSGYDWWVKGTQMGKQ